MAELLANEADYTISGPLMEYAIDELMKAGKIAELNDFVHNWTEL